MTALPPDELTTLIPDLMRVARRLVPRGSADDLVQEALLRVWSQLAKGAEIDDLKPYVMTTLRNLARRPPQRTEELTEDHMPQTPPEAPARIAATEVLDALAALSERDGALLRAVAIDGLSYAAIARRERVPVGTVMSRLARARARLRRAIDLRPDTPIETLFDPPR